MLILGSKLQAVEQAVQGIKSLWEIKDLGDIGIVLGIRVRRDRQKRLLSLDQSSYIQGLIEKFGLQDAKPISSPATDRNALISGSLDEPQADQALYRHPVSLTNMSMAVWIAPHTSFGIFCPGVTSCGPTFKPSIFEGSLLMVLNAASTLLMSGIVESAMMVFEDLPYCSCDRYRLHNL